MQAKASEENWDIIGVLNNDMIGNIEGVDGVIDNYFFGISAVGKDGNESLVVFPGEV